VVEDARYVVNNLRFDLGEDESPYIRRKSDAGQGRRPSAARYVTQVPPVKSYPTLSCI
jgi:hypothetical protein